MGFAMGSGRASLGRGGVGSGVGASVKEACGAGTTGSGTFLGGVDELGAPRTIPEAGRGVLGALKLRVEAGRTPPRRRRCGRWRGCSC